MLKSHLFFATCFVAATLSCLAQTNSIRRGSSIHITPSWKWAAQLWQSDKPYSAIRRNIDQFLAKGQNPATLQKKYAPFVKPRSATAEQLFRWSYATYKAAEAANRAVDRRKELESIKDRWSRSTLPSTYEYARLRFLVESRGLYPLALKGLGERLIQRDPRDFQVKVNLVKILATSPSRDERRKALLYAKKLTVDYPNRPDAYSALAMVNLIGANMKDDPLAASESIAAYRKFLQLTPPTPDKAERRKEAQYLIQTLQQSR